MTNRFRRFAERTGAAVGSPWTFAAVVAASLVWLFLGPVFGFSDTWQLTMNTVASRVTFLIAFLLQSSQNRDSRAMQLKLDELLRASGKSRSRLIQLEHLSDDELDALEAEFTRIRSRKAE